MAKKEDFALYTYNLSKLKNSSKVRFVYVLKGRGNEIGIVRMLKGKFLAPGCFCIPVRNEKEIQQVFARWNIANKREGLLIR